MGIWYLLKAKILQKLCIILLLKDSIKDKRKSLFLGMKNQKIANIQKTFIIVEILRIMKNKKKSRRKKLNKITLKNKIKLKNKKRLRNMKTLKNKK
mmetsp:Transcript_35704/g.6439  ORF Transcript_35704/g.6439 Transcript_35704/m.6439 type:complete len:96 (+) Transcript_35704:772-1059(+)